MTYPTERRKGPSNLTISISGIFAFVGLLASGIGVYIGIQTDISNLKRGEVYQEQTNQRLSGDIKDLKTEQRENAKEFNEKADRIIEHLKGK